MSRSSSRRKRVKKRQRQRKMRLDRVIRHFTKCPDKASPGGWSHDEDGMHVSFHCRSCGLKYVRHNNAAEIEIKGMGRVPRDPTVLDLMNLEPAKF
jgi:hypothetical protein